MPRLIIDEREIEVPEGTKVIDAAEMLGIVIPRFCYHEALGSVGACRMCAVKFIQGPFKGVQMSCMIEAQDGMVVSTTDQEAVEFRKRVIELLMKNHPLDCPVCDEGGQCLLQDETISGGHAMRRFPGPKRTYRDQYLGPFIKHEMNRCIHCYRCSRFYQEFAGYRDLGPMQIGDRLYFGRFSDGCLESPFSGNLVDICPTGVYTDKTARFKLRRWDLQRAPGLCNQCSLGCNTVANAHYRGVMRMEARFNRDVNGYFLCDAGRFGFSYANGDPGLWRRPLFPKIAGEVAGAADALSAARKALDDIAAKNGPGAVAVVGSQRNSLETQSMMNLVCETRGWLGPVFFFDPAMRLKTLSAVHELDGEIAVSMKQIENADFILVVGADPLNEAPMSAMAIRQAARKKAPVVTIDPRPVSLPCDSQHFAVLPKDIESYLGALILKAMGKDAASLGSESENFRAYLGSQLENFNPPESLDQCARLLAASSKPVIICGTDVTMETTPAFAADCVRLLNLCEKQAGLFNLLPGAGSFGAGLLSRTEVPTFADLVEYIENGRVRGLVFAESDPFHCYPDRARLESALSKLDFFLALDYFPSETARRASVFYPASTIFETGATFLNQEGRAQFASPVHCGGEPIRPGEHPPRVYSGLVPGGDHLPAWKALASIAGMEETCPDIAPEKFVPPSIPGFEALGYPVDGQRPALAKSGFKTQWGLNTFDKSQAPLTFELLMVEWIFGTSEFSAWSDSLAPAVLPPLMSISAKDAVRLGLADKDKVSVELAGGELEIVVSVSDRTAESVLIVPRHNGLEWQKSHDFRVFVSSEKIRKI